jgi:hypothetical protein
MFSLSSFPHFWALADSFGQAGDLKEGKIVELAKKNRALSVALDKERAKAGRLAAEVQRSVRLSSPFLWVDFCK